MAQYSSLQVLGGQSGQLLPCGQLSDEVLNEELLLMLDEELVSRLLDELAGIDDGLLDEPGFTGPQGSGWPSQVE